MPNEPKFNKGKFDAILNRLIAAKPVTFQDAVSKPKLKKDGTPKRGKASRATGR